MYKQAQAITKEAGQLALSYFEELSSVAVEAKGHLDLVTLADREVERFLITKLQNAYPTDGVFGEEGGDNVGKSGRTWVVDPIDGTFNFVRGGDQWVVSVGLFEQGIPKFGILYAPVRDEFYVGGVNVSASLNGMHLKHIGGVDRSRAASGVGFHPSIPVERRLDVIRFLLGDSGMMFRTSGSAAMSLMELARGEVDGYIGMGESSWDIMAALPILEQLGVKSTIDWNKSDLSTKFKFAAGSPEFLQIVSPIVSFGAELEMPE